MNYRGEPSVEEILDSIKRVIARDARDDDRHMPVAEEDDDDAFHSRGNEATDPADADEADEILELGEQEMVPRSSAQEHDRAIPMNEQHEENVAYDLPGAEPDDAFAEYPKGEDFPEEDRSVADDEDADTGGEPLTSAIVRDSMRKTFAEVARLSSGRQGDDASPPRETSLEGLARELLRPMLAQWLEANLPDMVERVVKAEIARIARRP